jgi:predicted flap endonuclease-1-like 5' DNA nuclease
MASNALDQALERHREMLDDVNRRLAAVRDDRPLPPETALGELDQQLGRLRARLDEAEAAKAAAVERYDQAVAGYRRDIKELETRREEVRRGLEGRDGPGGPLPGGDRPVDAVRGIGPQFRARLEEAGVRSVRELAALQPARLAAILEISEDRAAALIESARQVG